MFYIQSNKVSTFLLNTISHILHTHQCLLDLNGAGLNLLAASTPISLPLGAGPGLRFLFAISSKKDFLDVDPQDG